MEPLGLELLGVSMNGGVFARLSGLSVAGRVFAAPLMGIVLTVAALVLADRQSEQALGAVDGIHREAAERLGRIDRLVAIAYVIHSDVSRHLALSGSGIEEAKLQAMRDAETGDARADDRDATHGSGPHREEDCCEAPPGERGRREGGGEPPGDFIQPGWKAPQHKSPGSRTARPRT